MKIVAEKMLEIFFSMSAQTYSNQVEVKGSQKSFEEADKKVRFNSNSHFVNVCSVVVVKATIVKIFGKRGFSATGLLRRLFVPSFIRQGKSNFILNKQDRERERERREREKKVKNKDESFTAETARQNVQKRKIQFRCEANLAPFKLCFVTTS